jgi:hypothetical protein
MNWMAERIQRAPGGLAAAGRALWKAILSDIDPGWELDRRELHLLERACVCADRRDELDSVVRADGAAVAGSKGQITAHPCLSEARQLELVQLRLLSSLQLEDPTTARAGSSPAWLRAQEAADARWSRKARVEAQLAAVRGNGGTPTG